MNRHSASRTRQWRILSVFVPKRDGRTRVEMAIQIPSRPASAVRPI